MSSSSFPPQLPEARACDVVGLGANAADHLVTIARHPQPGEKIRFRDYTYQGGGQTATALVTIARLGYRTRYLGGVGDDGDGRANLAGLEAEGVDVSGTLTRPGGLTQRAFILVDETSGERTIIWGRSEGMVIAPGEIDAGGIAEARILHTDAQDPRAAAHAGRIAHRAGMPVIADLELVRPGLEQFLPEIDFLIAAAGFPKEATGAGDLDAATRMLEERSAGALVIVTLGARGAVARIEGALESFPAYAVEAVDTTGAGDVFHGAFAVACLEGMALREALDFSNAVAAIKCRQAGGRAGIPRSLEEVERFRRETGHRTPGRR